MKYIRQGLQFPWFLKRTTISGKISSGIKLGLRSPSNLSLVSLNNVKH
jgi:hypothetical protein